MYAPLSGPEVEINDEITDTPEVINDDPYDGGWLVVIEMADPEELKLLMSAEDYQEQVAEDSEE